MDFKYQKVAEDSDWYRILDKDDKEYGLFSLNSVTPENPQYSKHMDLTFNENIARDFTEGKNFELLHKICHYCFKSVLEITRDEGMDKCKLRARDDLVLVIYRAFADILSKSDDYIVAPYGRWIEIKKKT